MLFNSFEFIYIFLPTAFIGYFLFNRYNLALAGKVWILAASCFFYAWWDYVYLPLLIGSIVVNFCVGRALAGDSGAGGTVYGKKVLVLGISFNLVLLVLFKYLGFITANLGAVPPFRVPVIELALPIGISFFTFTQIAFLVDAYKGKAKDYNPVSYGMFVTYFPHLIAGPIIHHKAVMPQFDDVRNKHLDYKNIYTGLCLFFIGLFKKVIIADTLAVYANAGFSNAPSLTLIDGWAVSLSYTLQLYYDFSGYTDMALGMSLLFNIQLPINFNSPYRALDIRDFWRRWHITLSNFLRDYLYIPLGGNRKSAPRTLLNLFLTFLLGGIWHGAGWTFIIWGVMHGCAMVVYTIWKKLKMELPNPLAWLLTFMFVNVAWVFFRAKTTGEAVSVLKAMAGLNGVVLYPAMKAKFAFLQDYGVTFGAALNKLGFDRYAVTLIAVSFLASIIWKNSNQIANSLKPSWGYCFLFVFIAVFSLMRMDKVSEFIYFNF